MSGYKLTYKQFSEHSILIEWPAKIDKNIHEDVLNFKKSLHNKVIKQILYVNNSYNSLLVFYDLTIRNIYDEILHLKELYSRRVTINKSALKLWEIPVCYEDEFGVDLELIFKQNNLTKSQIIQRHSQVDYRVFFIGFLPGFLYLGGLDKSLHIPRKSSPRLGVEKGAVAIGGSQTGIYPGVSPGGWNIIGNSPVCFFDINKNEPCFAKAGDTIRFFKVSKEAYLEIKDEVDKGIY